MSTGDLPPSSSITRLRLPAAPWTIFLPTSVEPVKAILSTPGWSTRAWPAVWPYPFTMFTTPSGTPASASTCSNTSAERGVSSAGLRMLLHPAASAGASLAAALNAGPFHGTMSPTTPTGSLSV